MSAPLGAALLLAPLAGVHAQSGGSVSDFKLPPKPTAAPTVVGPTDKDIPAPRTPAPSPAPSATQPAPAPAPTPTISLPAPAPSAARPSATPRPRAVPAPSAATPAEAGPAPTAAPTLGSGSPFPSAPVSATPFAPDVAAPASPALAQEEQSGTPWWLWPLLAAAAAIAGGLAWLAWRRRQPRAAAPPEFVRPQVPAAPAPERRDIPAPPAPPVVAPSVSGLNVALKATRMSATLMNATLSYRLSVTNTGKLPIADIAVTGDMISAHSSVPQQEMLGGDAAPMPALHRITALAPGESAVLTGDIRLPLSAITPIRRGQAQLFVPLARFRTSGTAAGIEVVEHGAFLVGQEPEARAKLQPFRLDLGPRLYSQVGQRPIVVAA